MSLPWYLAGAFALASVVTGGLFAWRGTALEVRDATIAAREATIADYESKIALAASINAANEEELKLLRDDLDRYAELAVRYEAEARARGAALKQALKEVASAPASDDGPIAPVLARVLERMRASDAPADGVDEDRARRPADPGR